MSGPHFRGCGWPSAGLGTPGRGGVMADPWHRQLGAGTGQQGPTRTPELVHFMLALLRSLLMAETVLLASRWHRDTLCLVFGCDKICVLGLSRVPLLESESCSVMSDSLRPHGLYSPWNSPGQNTGVGCLSLLQVLFFLMNFLFLSFEAPQPLPLPPPQAGSLTFQAWLY